MNVIDDGETETPNDYDGLIWLNGAREENFDFSGNTRPGERGLHHPPKYVIFFYMTIGS